jgi:hypothetical protein
MIISTSAISESYRVIDTIMLVDSHKPEGFFGSSGFDFEKCFIQTKMKLEQKAEALGGNAVIGCDFEIRVAANAMGSGQVLEIFCFGTVVKTLD